LLALCDILPRDVDAVVLSACVQMPSLAVIEAAEQRLGLPVLSAATATLFQVLDRLELATWVPGAGHLLSGSFDRIPQLAR
jgi:maleate isomerase